MADWLIPRWLQVVLLAALAVIIGLGKLARRNPGVAWLQPFRLPVLDQGRKEEMAARSWAMTGLELLFMGVVWPLGGYAVSIMVFNPLSVRDQVLWLWSVSAVCIAGGVWCLWRANRLGRGAARDRGR